MPPLARIDPRLLALNRRGLANRDQRLLKGSYCGRRATLAQLVEQLIRNQQVVGSNPTGGSRRPKKCKEFFDHFYGRSVEPV